jgi:hypothetical protein
MTDECSNDCVEAQRFPQRPFNRPGLPHIGYRIGTYADIRDAILRKLNLDEVLKDWTHREADDPGIALLEGAAILGDILTFYQELYANEAYLRTAQWRESIADLVRLLGYRLSPGLGGKATFTFGVKGDRPVTIPAGFTIKAQLEPLPQPAEFQSSIEVIAYPALSQFHLYRPRHPAQPIAAGINQLEIQSVGGATDVASLAALNLQKGDRLMLIPDSSVFDATGTPYSAQPPAEILIVSKVQPVLDRTIVEFEGKLTVDRGTTLKAYRLGRSFRHFGHNAPTFTTSFDNTSKTSTQTLTDFFRDFYTSSQPTSPSPNYYSSLAAQELPLDQQVNDLAIGAPIICQGAFAFFVEISFTLVKTIQALRSESLKWGNLTGASTVLTLANRLVTNDSFASFLRITDIRRLQFHEVKSAAIVLRSPSQWEDGAFTEPKLNFFGTYEQVRSLAGRRLLLQKDQDTQQVTVTSTSESFLLSGKDKINPWLWEIALDKIPDPFLRQDFDELEPKVIVYGNLVEATQGKAEKEAILGNGDSRQLFQSFKLPKAPLTYFNSASETPPEVPELQVYVGDRFWKRVPSLFGKGPKDEIYIVREDANGDSWVQFGDGKTGTRLPSGIGNVLAKYRSGIGAHGALQENTTVQGGNLDRLDKIWLPQVAAGGSQPETGDNAREAAPGKIQSLGRLVSIKDFETETLAISGVSKAKAAWKLVHNIPTMVITVLMETGRAAEIEEVRILLNTYNRCRGPQRFPIRVDQGSLKYIYVDITAGIDPIIPEKIIRNAIKEAIGVTGEEGDGINGSRGLMGIAQRQFGQKEYASRIEGTVQNVEGVKWCRVTQLGFLFGSDDDPTKLMIPTPKELYLVLECGGSSLTSATRLGRRGDEPECILALHIGHFNLTFSLLPSLEEC